jgi:hypothetical protein
VVDLVKSRLTRAKSVQKRKVKNGIDIVAAKEALIRSLTEADE